MVRLTRSADSCFFQGGNLLRCTFGVLLASQCLALVCAAGTTSWNADSSGAESWRQWSGNNRASSSLFLAAAEENRNKKYHWLFRDKPVEQQSREPENIPMLEKLDRDIKNARKLYLSGDTDNGILKYRSAIDQFELLVEDIPPGHILLNELEQRFGIFDELATKILGPVHLDPQESLAPEVFHLLEKRRMCRRNMTLKKAGPLNFFDVPATLLQEESELLGKLLELKEEIPTAETRQAEGALKETLADVRKSLQKSSARYAQLRRSTPVPLADIRKNVLTKNEVILDFNLFADRMAVGVITAEKAVYYQLAGNRSEIDRTVFLLQEKLKEFTMGGGSSFMGHAWKEPCRRIYRSLMGKLPPLPPDKTTFFIIPDRSLWYLPFSSMLDAEDRPFGQDRVVSIIPSVDILKFIRSAAHNKPKESFAGNLIVFESLPWVPQEELGEKAEPARKKSAQKMTEEEKIERLILTNPVYPKPSDIVVNIQKMFKKSDVWIGPTATLDRLAEYKDRHDDIAILAVPLAVTDVVTPDRQPTFFFSPNKSKVRKFDVSGFFATPFGSSLAVTPISWLDVQDKDAALGEGPLLVSTAMHYAGIRMALINYSDPNWGGEEPFLVSILKHAAERRPPGQVLGGYVRELPAGLDPAFSGKPPSWTGWILMGDPN
ncbi:MAG TPA: hypothetical protein VK463_13530 [Desulfomonilaceae bacterium]|nr:hypothetical protein [Desulfomonilaceae bacterium]